MKAKEAAKFILSGYVSRENCGIVNVSQGKNACDYFDGLCDTLDFDKEGSYFWFYTNDANREYDLKKCLSFIDKDSQSKFADYEFPTKDGYYILFSLEE